MRLKIELIGNRRAYLSHILRCPRKPSDPPMTNTLGHGSFDCDDACIPDTVNGCTTVRQLYELVGDKYERYTVPLLWDKERKEIVCNESATIIEMLNNNMNNVAKHPEVNFFPEEMRENMKAVDEWVYEHINNGVYKCGFARKQAAYEEAFEKVVYLSLRSSTWICYFFLTAFIQFF